MLHLSRCTQLVQADGDSCVLARIVATGVAPHLVSSAKEIGRSLLARLGQPSRQVRVYMYTAFANLYVKCAEGPHFYPFLKESEVGV